MCPAGAPVAIALLAAAFGSDNLPSLRIGSTDVKDEDDGRYSIHSVRSQSAVRRPTLRHADVDDVLVAAGRCTDLVKSGFN